MASVAPPSIDHYNHHTILCVSVYSATPHSRLYVPHNLSAEEYDFIHSRVTLMLKWSVLQS